MMINKRLIGTVSESKKYIVGNVAVQGVEQLEAYFGAYLPQFFYATQLFSSFGPAVALANLGSTLQNTFAAGNRAFFHGTRDRGQRIKRKIAGKAKKIG